MIEESFRYRDKIIWRKPEGYIRISRRSGVLIQHPYPMYFYSDNIFEEILIFQKGKFDYTSLKNTDKEALAASRIDVKMFNQEKWSLSVWDITNVLPLQGRLKDGIAAFPEEIPKRLIRLFSVVGETVLDPFLGSGTTMKVAMELGRNNIDYEIDLELKPMIMKKTGQTTLAGDNVEAIVREDAKKLRTFLQKRVSRQRFVTK